MPICCIRLLCDWWFHLCHRIVCICYFVASYLSSLWYDLFWWRCFMLPIRRDSVSLLKFPFLSHVQVLSCEMFIYWSFKTPMELFSFPFLFPSYCYSVIYSVVSIVSDGRNQFSFVFFYVVFESLYGCVNAVFDAGKVLLLPLFLVHIVYPRRLWDVMPCGWSLFF